MRLQLLMPTAMLMMMIIIIIIIMSSPWSDLDASLAELMGSEALTHFISLVVFT